MKALIDGDSIPFIAACVSDAERRFYRVHDREFQYSVEAKKFCAENNIDPAEAEFVREAGDPQVVIDLTDSIVRGIMEAISDDIEIYLKGKGNFRETLYPEYKASRKTLIKPPWHDLSVQVLLEHYDAKIVNGMEADDAVAIRSFETGGVICSIDKDLKQVPGLHYDYKKQEFSSMSPEEADHFLFTQVITGDSTDDIPGVHRYGVKRAHKALKGCRTVHQMWDKCVELHGSAASAALTGSLVYLLRYRGDKWNLG